MGDEALQVLKHAFIGAGVGAVMSTAGDFVYQKLIAQVDMGGSARGQEMTRAAMAIVVSTGTAAFAFYGGDRVMQSFGGTEDPMQGLFFYHTLWNSMNTTAVTPMVVRNLLYRYLLAPSAPKQKASDSETGGLPTASMGSPAKNCAGPSCGNLNYD